MGRFSFLRICTGELIAAFATYSCNVAFEAVADAARYPRAQCDPSHASRMISNLEVQALYEAMGFLLAIKTDVEEALRSLPEEVWMTIHRRSKLQRLMKDDVWEPIDAEEP